MTGLVQFVDLTLPEADGIRGFAMTTDDGRHYIELVEADGQCEGCDGNESTVYRLKQTTHTCLLCRDHLKKQPYHLGFEEGGIQ